MRNEIDLLILNNCPAFYKINLYNEIAKTRKIFVVFIGYYDQVVISSNFREQIQFPYTILNEMEMSKRNIVTSFLALQKIIARLNFRYVIYGGYVDPEFILTSILIPKSKNILQTESAGETKLSGLRFYLKQILLKRYSKAIASGSIHARMLKKMGFNKKIHICMGVGLINKADQQVSTLPDRPAGQLNFLYVGRLISLKNLQTLIKVFNGNGLPLTIAGTGELREELMKLANPNIAFSGFVPNADLHGLYRKHHVLVLPSFSEAWGLVVEEALYCGCVLILSDRVGCSEDLLIAPNTGLTFDPVNVAGLSRAVREICTNYGVYKKNVDQFNINAKDLLQVKVYTTDVFSDL